jgi:3-methyladenine DNA glycosylase Mpg
VRYFLTRRTPPVTRILLIESGSRELGEKAVVCLRKAFGADLPIDVLGRGPGNLARALGVSLRHNRSDLVSSTLTIEDHGLRLGPVAWGPRIGIRVGVDRPWRCFVAGHPAVSGGTIRS